MVVAAARATRPRFYQVTEAAPCDTDVVGTIVAVEVAVDTILEVAMVYPDIGAGGQRQVVVAIDVIGSCCLEGEVA